MITRRTVFSFMVMALGYGNALGDTPTVDPAIRLAQGSASAESGLVAPAPHWISSDPEGQRRLVGHIKRLKKHPNEIHKFGQIVYSDQGPLGIPELTLEHPALEYRGQGGELNRSFLNLATTACHRLDFIARKAGLWGPECRVTKIIEPPTKGSIAQATGPGARVGDFIYTINALGEDHVRYVLENGADKKIDVTVRFLNVRWQPDG